MGDYKESYKRILKATSLFGGVHCLNILINLVRTKLVAVLIGPEGVGLNSIYNEMRELIHTSTNLGMDVSGVREISQAFEQEDAGKTADAIRLTRSWVLLLALVGSLICFLLSEPLSWITFSDASHTWDYALLAPAIGFSTMTCGEMAILKGTRRIKPLATISVLNVMAGLITTIPLYYKWGMGAIVPALVLLSVVMYIIVICYTYKAFPLRLNYRKSYMSQGVPMLMIGTSFVLTGMISHGTELAIRTYLNHVGSLETVGLYSAAITIVMTYGGIIFASLDNDYFPRISGLFADVEKRCETVNSQIEVLLMLVVPLTIVMIAALPIAVPILFSTEFNAVVPMAQVATLGLLFRAVYLPVAYIPLAAGDSKNFLMLETVSYLVVLVSVITGYHFYSLIGAGMAIVVSNLMDMLITLLFVRYKYAIVLKTRSVFIIFIASIIISGVICCCLYF